MKETMEFAWDGENWRPVGKPAKEETVESILKMQFYGLNFLKDAIHLVEQARKYDTAINALKNAEAKIEQLDKVRLELMHKYDEVTLENERLLNRLEKQTKDKKEQGGKK